ncbi:MAG TPA: cache domain-containing protein [Candidatus Omnitrophota bacterium]|nr:cache domain-containing protein [Candidatus Omnitrophota bacterium]
MGLLRTLVLALMVAVSAVAPACADSHKLTPDQVRALTIKAVDLIQSEGLAAASARFNALGEFKHGEIYVNVIDFEGVWLCYPPNPELVGRSVLNVKDLDGRYLVQEILATAIDRGEGWVEYKWMNPANQMVQPKRTFVKRVPGKALVAYIGLYE